MKKYILLITTIFFSHSLNAQTDSLYIKELDNIFGTAVDYYYVGKYVESLYELNNIVKPYHLDLKENNEDATLVFVKALTLKSIIYIYLQNYGEAEHILEQAESLSEILTNKKKEKKIWKRRIESAWGEYYLYRNVLTNDVDPEDIRKSKVFYEKATKLAEERLHEYQGTKKNKLSPLIALSAGKTNYAHALTHEKPLKSDYIIQLNKEALDILKDVESILNVIPSNERERFKVRAERIKAHVYYHNAILLIKLAKGSDNYDYEKPIGLREFSSQKASIKRRKYYDDALLNLDTMSFIASNTFSSDMQDTFRLEREQFLSLGKKIEIYLDKENYEKAFKLVEEKSEIPISKLITGQLSKEMAGVVVMTERVQAANQERFIYASLATLGVFMRWSKKSGHKILLNLCSNERQKIIEKAS